MGLWEVTAYPLLNLSITNKSNAKYEQIIFKS